MALCAHTTCQLAYIPTPLSNIPSGQPGRSAKMDLVQSLRAVATSISIGSSQNSEYKALPTRSPDSRCCSHSLGSMSRADECTIFVPLTLCTTVTRPTSDEHQ